MSGDATAALRKKSIAIGSGKGGVGKSTTALNLAVFYAKRGLRVGLFDLDPLSNMAIILDIDESELAGIRQNYGRSVGRLADYVYRVFPGLDLVFPKPKLARGASSDIRGLVFGSLAAELSRSYDVLLYDLPAGIGAEENLLFLPSMDHLLVVTNSEPTSHVSAGGYIKAALEIAPRLRIYFWHNKFNLVHEGGFNPSHVIENYNRYVDEELQIDVPAVRALRDVAYVPHDPALDLLQTSLSLEGSAQAKLREICDTLQKKILADIPGDFGLDSNTTNLIKHYLSHEPLADQPAAVARRAEEYVVRFSANTSSPGIGRFLAKKKSALFSDGTRGKLERYITTVKSEPLRNLALQAVLKLDRSLAGIKESRGPFAVPRSALAGREMHTSVLALLKALSGAKLDSFTRNLAAMVLFNFALTKLMASPAVQRTVIGFLPRRRTSRGTAARDRRRQIASLLTHDAEYHRNYFSLIKALFPLVLRQVDALAKSFGLAALVFRTPAGDWNRDAYLKLFTSFLHDSIHAGLGVFIGFKFNPAAEAIKNGASTLLQAAGIAAIPPDGSPVRAPRLPTPALPK